MTLTPQLLKRVRSLLARGCRINQTARLLNHEVSKSTVAKIAHGLYHLKRDPSTAPNESAPTPTLGKCPGCNYLVELPCRICAARFYRHRRHLKRIARRNAATTCVARAKPGDA